MASRTYNVFDRLAIHQLNSLDVIRETVPKPSGYLPPRSLPTWKTMPVEQKLPLIPAPPGAIYYTRANLGKTLFRKGGIYQLNDPLNQERIPSDKFYEELHDPYPRIEQNPYIARRLVELDLVSDVGEALCFLKEFNRYRLYLSTLYNDKVHQKLALMDDLARFQLEETRAFLAYEKKQAAGKVREDRLRKVQEYERKRQLNKEIRFHEAELRRRENLERLAEEKSRRQVTQGKINAELEKAKRQRLRECFLKDHKWRKDMMHKITLREMTATVQKQHVAKNKKIIYEKRIAEWFDAKLLSSAQRLEREHEIQADFIEEIKQRGAARQRHVEKMRDELPYRIARRLAEKKRLENIVRKYAMRWLNRVRARLRKPKDETHESHWTPPNRHALEDCVSELYRLSGHTKLDDLVMNVLIFKEAIKKQIAMEEEEERRRSMGSDNSDRS